MTKARDNSNNPDVVLASGSFTSAAALNFSNILTDTYKFYEFNIHAYGSATTDMVMRFRENTTDKAANYYQGGNYGTYQGGTGSAYAKNNGLNIGITAIYGGTAASAARVVIYRPEPTRGMASIQTWDNANAWGVTTSAIGDTMTNLNGFSVFPNSGTMTGYYLLIGKRA